MNGSTWLWAETGGWHIWGIQTITQVPYSFEIFSISSVRLFKVYVLTKGKVIALQAQCGPESG